MLDRAAASGELMQLQARANQLRAAREDAPYALPITGVATGFGGAYLFTTLALELEVRPLLAPAAVLALLGIGSTVWFAERMRSRKPLNNELRSIEARREMLVVALTLADRQGGCGCAFELASVELQQIDARLSVLHRERASFRLAGPVVLGAIGIASSVFVAAAAGFTYWLQEIIPEYDDGRTPAERRKVRNIGLGALPGLALGIAGGLWFHHRLEARRAFKPEVDALRRRRKELVPTVAPTLGMRGAELGLRVSF
jgi:hypothetical protein